MDENFAGYIKWLDDQLPDQCTNKDLVDCQLFTSVSSLSQARAKGFSPPYMQFPGGRILYLKKDVIEWAKSLYRKGKNG